jgi:hypothetical protein
MTALERDLRNWRRRFLAAAERDRLVRLLEEEGGPVHADDVPSADDARRRARELVGVVALAVRSGRLDQRPVAELRRFIARQRYDIRRSRAAYVVRLGAERGSLARLLVGRLSDVSLSELAWLHARGGRCRIDVTTPRGRRMDDAEQRSVVAALESDLLYDCDEDECRLHAQSDELTVSVEVEWTVEAPPFGLEGRLRALSGRRDED